VAAAAEHKLEVLKRHRTGAGAWFAVINAYDWEDPFREEGEVRTLAEVKCENRSTAVTKARQLLAEHAAELGENTSIQAEIVCELEVSEI
jgi:hypothetical protein